MPLLSIAENIFLGNEPAKMGVIDWAQAFNRTPRGAEEGRPQREAQHAGHQSRRRQAATGRDRQGAVEGRQAADPRRADRLAQRGRQRRAAQAADRVPRPGHHLDPDLAQAQRAGQGRRFDHRAARRHHGRDDRLPQGEDQRRPDHQEHGRPRNVRPLSAPPAEDRREAVRDQELEGRAPAPRRPRSRQGRRPARQPRRDRRHRRPDGGGAHRTGDERVRPRLRPQHYAARR